MQGVTSTQADQDGFYVTSDAGRNRFAGNTAAGNGDDGFDISGDRNALTRNTAQANVEDGFDVRGGKNKVAKNSASGNIEGYDIRSSDPCSGNRYRKNSIGTRSDDCIR